MRYLITLNFIHSYWHRQVGDMASLYSPDDIDDLLAQADDIIASHPDKLFVKAVVKFRPRLYRAMVTHVMDQDD